MTRRIVGPSVCLDLAQLDFGRPVGQLGAQTPPEYSCRGLFDRSIEQFQEPVGHWVRCSKTPLNECIRFSA